MIDPILNINCDVGEGAANESQLFPYIQSCNVACGGHAGNLQSMRNVVKLAKEHSVKIGAHPSYPDRINFGRTSIKMNETFFIEVIQKQINRLELVLKEFGQKLHHIKPHGALYNDLVSNELLANQFLKAITPYKKKCIVICPL